MKNPRLLQFAPRLPWPLDTGARLRNYHLAQVLATRMQVSLLAFGLPPAEELTRIYKQIVTVPRSESYSFTNVLRGAVSNTPLPLLNYTTGEMLGALAQTLETNDFDVVQVESIHLMNYLPTLRAARRPPLVICDWHNVESDLMQQYADHEPRAARRCYARRTARLMKESERRALNEFDAHIAVSEVDAARLRSIRSGAEVLVIENGVDAAYYADEPAPSKNRLVFVGSMDYHANIEGVKNFTQHVWPVVRARKPDLRFTIVGRDPAAAVRDLSVNPGVEVTGSVPDVRPFYREAIAAVVPLNVGGGSRLKVLEAMAAGVPVVSTTLGAEGLSVTDGEDILLTNSDQQLAGAILDLIDDESLRGRLITAGRTLVKRRYDWSSVGAKLADEFERLLSVQSLSVRR